MAVGVKHSELFDSSSKSIKYIRSLDLIKAELEVLLRFKRYSLFFGNHMGLDAERFLHLGNNVATFNLVRKEIETVLMKYGRVNILEVKMTFNKENNTLEIDLVLAPKRSSRNSFSLSLTLGE